MVTVNKARVENKICDVITFEEYHANPNAYSPEYTVISKDDKLYPIRSSSDNRPGVYQINGPFSIFIDPIGSDIPKFSADNIINFNDASSLRDIIEKQNQLRTAERAILTTVDNLFVPQIDQNDAPEMKGLKEAIISKQIDIDKYAQRFGRNFNNDKRLLKKDSITMSKLRCTMEALDMKGTLIIEDKNSDVPNPIGKKIVVELTSEGESVND